MKPRMLGMLAFVSGTLLALIGCESAGPIEAQAVDLPPMPQPERNVGYEWAAMKNGQEYVTTIVSEEGDMWTWKDSDGCSYTDDKTRFAPAVRWENCHSSSDGTQAVALKGDVWPLEVGKNWIYTFSGSDVDGNTWQGERKCTVEGATKIRTVPGYHSTYKVVCRDPWNFRTFYISPTKETTVYYDWYRAGFSQRFTFDARVFSGPF